MNNKWYEPCEIKVLSPCAAIRKRPSIYGKNIILETDMGRDPDDLFALLYLVSAGVNIKAITLSPGDPDQIAFAKFITKELGLDIPIGVGKKDRDKSSLTGLHQQILENYKQPTAASPDGFGPDIIKSIKTNTGDIIQGLNLLAIGPLSSVGPAIREGVKFCRATMQGGFIGYDEHDYEVERLDKFEGKKTVPTFNLNGDRKSGLDFIAAEFPKHFVSKNVCHTMIYDQNSHELVCSVKPKNRADELLRKFMTMYLQKHKEGKKFHDPVAAVAHFNPQICKWVQGNMYYAGGAWGFTANKEEPFQEIIVDIDREKFWQQIASPDIGF